MPRIISIEDDAILSLDECVDRLRDTGFDPRDEDSLAHAALQLRRLGNDRAFLGDMLVSELAARHREYGRPDNYGPQCVVLSAPGAGFFLRANMWPAAQDHMLKASGGGSFSLGLPHDHNFSFLTLGYFGPGSWSDYYTYDYETVAGWSGEPVDLRFEERARLEEGKIMLYRAHRDVHLQLPADSLSVSINIMHTHGAQGWPDQYRFDVENKQVGGIVSGGASEAWLRIAVGLGGEEAIDLAHRFAARHPSDRMRLTALDALASIAPDDATRDTLWRGAESGGSVLIAREATARREALTG